MDPGIKWEKNLPAIAIIAAVSWTQAASSIKVYAKWAGLKFSSTSRALAIVAAVARVHTNTRNW